MFLNPGSKEEGEFRVVIRKGKEDVVIESFTRESDARDYFDKATAEDSFLFQVGLGGEFVVSLEVPETVWKPVAKRMVL